MPERMVVIGGDAAGMSAASQARRRRGPDDLAIVAFERGRHVSYSACGIPFFVGGIIDDPDELIARSAETFREKFSIDVRIGHEVLAIDTGARHVSVRDRATDRVFNEPFDQLVIATGATPICPDLPGADAAGIHGVQTLDDGIAVRRLVDTVKPRRAVVIGGGYIGLELAEALIMRGLEVSLVEREPQPMSVLDPDMGAMVANALRDKGVRLYLGESAEAFETSGSHVCAVRTAARTLPADLVILGLGVRPNSGLGRDAGLPVGANHGLLTDRRMATPVPGVWAAGDCVEVFHRVSRRSVSIPLGTHANRQGRVIGINIGGGYAAFEGVLGTAVTKICNVEIARTGLSEHEASAAGFMFDTVKVESTTRAGYYPGATNLTIKLVFERITGRLLGAQIVGREGAAKRIDVLATAIWNGMGVDDLQNVDLSYAPPFSPLWDPVAIAARKAAEHREEERAPCN